MRTLINKYAGTCRKCGKDIPAGQQVGYEKHVGIFCPECTPTDSEEIRAYRQEAGDRRADKYDEWANKREKKARQVFEHNAHYTGDHAFNTQPGHIAGRARIIKSEQKAVNDLNTADRFRDKADSLRRVVVKGDAAKRDEERRGFVRAWIKPGMIVDTGHMGFLKVLKVNKKTATIEGRFGKFTHDLMYLNPVKSEMRKEILKRLREED